MCICYARHKNLMRFSLVVKEAYTKAAFCGTLVAVDTIHPQNVTSSINLHIVVLWWIPEANFGKVKTKATSEEII